MKKEIWKGIEGYRSIYCVSNLGRIRSLDRLCRLNRVKRDGVRRVNEKILKLSINGQGYFYVNLSKNGKQKRLKVHLLILNTFKRKPSKKYICNHKDGNKLNNKLENLEWTTYSGNLQHAYKNDLIRKGLTIKEMNDVQKIYRQGGISQRALAKKFRVDQKTIWNVINNKIARRKFD